MHEMKNENEMLVLGLKVRYR